MSNPYVAPQSSDQPAAQQPALAGRDDAVTPRMVTLMAEARWWTLVLGLLALLMSGFLLLVLLGALAGRLAISVAFGPTDLAILGLMFLFYAVPGGLLFVASQRMAVFVASGRSQDLIAALAMQRTLWVVLGVIGMLWGTLTTLKLVVAFLQISNLIDGGA